MKLKLDENVPSDISLPGDVDTVEDEGLSGSHDEVIWEAAQREERLLVTQDLDFSDLRRFEPGTHHGIVLLRLANPSPSALSARILQIVQCEDFDTWSGCFDVATDTKIRVRRPD